MDWLKNVFNAIDDWFVGSAGPAVLDWLKTGGLAILTGLLILVVGLWVAKIVSSLVSRALRKTKADAGMAGFIVSSVKFVLKLVVIVAAIAAIGVNITSIITALGAAGITIGLAMQDSLSNFASGVLILYNKPFVVGEYVEIDGSSGTVKAIELMHTTLITPENKELIFPNSRITANKIINYNRLESRRLDMQFSVAYGTDITAAKQCLLDVCSGSQYRIENGKDTVVGVNSFGDSAIVFDVKMWIPANSYWDAYYEIQEQVYAEFAKNGIAIPFNQLDVHIKNS